MIVCPQCGHHFESKESVKAGDSHPAPPAVKVNEVRLALLHYPNLPHKKIGEMFGISRRYVWGIAERYRIATRHRSDRGKRKGSSARTQQCEKGPK